MTEIKDFGGTLYNGMNSSLVNGFATCLQNYKLCDFYKILDVSQVSSNSLFVKVV